MTRARWVVERRNAVRLVALVLICVVSSFGSMRHAVAQDVVEETLRPLASEGRAALRAERWGDALRAFENGREAALAAQEVTWVSHFHFLQGLAHQRRAGQEDSAESWSLARKAYRAAVQVRPENGAAWHNAAQAVAALGRIGETQGDLRAARRLYAEAQEAYGEALKHADEKQPRYLADYATFLQERELWDECRRLYRDLLAENPNDHTVLQWTADLYRKSRDPDGLVRYLWYLLRRGQPQRAQDVALSALEDAEARDWLLDQYCVELLTIVVAGMGEQVYDPRDYPKSGVARRLAKLPGRVRRFLRPGIESLITLHTLSSRNPDDFAWWREVRGSPARKGSLSPAEALRKLALSLGDWYRARARAAGKDPVGMRTRLRATKQARQYYDLGLLIASDTPAPEAVERQAALWIDLGDRKELAALVQRDIEAPGADLGTPAAQPRWQRQRFVLHRLLGKAAEVSRPQLDPAVADKLIASHYQASVDSAIRFNEATRGSVVLQVPPTLMRSLDTALRADGREEAAVATRVHLADHYLKLGERGAATTVLGHVKTDPEADLPTSVRSDALRLRTALEGDAATPTWRQPLTTHRMPGRDLVGVVRKPVLELRIDGEGSRLAVFEADGARRLSPAFDYEALGRVLVGLVKERGRARTVDSGRYLTLGAFTISGGTLMRVQYAEREGTALMVFRNGRVKLDVPFAVRLARGRKLPDFTYLRTQ